MVAERTHRFLNARLPKVWVVLEGRLRYLAEKRDDQRFGHAVPSQMSGDSLIATYEENRSNGRAIIIKATTGTRYGLDRADTTARSVHSTMSIRTVHGSRSGSMIAIRPRNVGPSQSFNSSSV